MSRAPREAARKAAATGQPVKAVNLALQGGGSHGAHTWGVLVDARAMALPQDRSKARH